jgi:hypothetical protein
MSITMSQLAARFSTAANRVDDVTERHLRTFAVVGVGFMKKEIQSEHAVDTGAMLNSTAADRVSSSTYLIGPTVGYAPYVALGTSRMPARPFHIAAARKLNDQRRGHWRRYKEDLGI